MRPLIAFLALPLAELVSIMEMGRYIGTFPTIGLLFLDMVVGVALIRNGGMQGMAEMRRHLRDMRNPAAGFATGGFRMLAGLLLVIPGFLTDVIAVLLLLPPVQLAVLRRFPVSGTIITPGRQTGGATVIDGEFVVVDAEAPQIEGNSGRTRH